MGSCNSCETRTIDEEDNKVKVIILNGKLLEYRSPVKVSQILEENPKCFICNADDMDFNDFVKAINEDELQNGELYFVLPLSWLNRRLQPVDMAALAVKGSLALSSGGSVMSSNFGCCCISTRVFGRLVSSYIGGRKYERKATAGGGWGGSVTNGGDYKRLNFGTRLTVILEE